MTVAEDHRLLLRGMDGHISPLRPAAADQGSEKDSNDLYVRVDHDDVAAAYEVDARIDHDEHCDVEDDRDDEVRQRNPEECAETGCV